MTSGRARSRFGLLLGVWLALSAAPAASQMSEVEFDILSARMANALKKGEFNKALPLIGQIKASGRDYTPSLIYFEGFALENLQRLQEANAAYRSYVERAGNAGAYYNKALGRIVEIEDRLDQMLARYKKLLDARPSKKVKAEIARLEAALGGRAAPIRAERERKAALEAQRRAADIARRAADPWVRVIDKPKGWQVFTTPVPLADGRIVVVGNSNRAACKTVNGKALVNNWWVVVLNAAGDVEGDVDHCTRGRAGYKFHTFLKGAALNPAGKIIAAGATHRGRRQLANVHLIDPATLTLTPAAPYARFHGATGGFFNIFENAGATRAGGLFAAGYGDINKTRYGVAAEYDGTGRMLWASPMNDAQAARRYRGVAVLPSGRRLAVGTATEQFLFSDETVGIVDLFDPTGPGAVRDAKGVSVAARTVAKFGERRTLQNAAVAPDGRIAVVGLFKLYSDVIERRGLIALLGTDLAKQWTNEALGRQSKDNRLFSVAYHDGGFIAGGGYATARGDWDAWLLKFDMAGKVLWNRTYPGTKGADSIWGIAPLPNGKGLIVAGSRAGAGLVMKLTPDGQLK